jgi:hypothetical protein
MKRAGPSLIKELGLLPKDEIEKYELMSKSDCDIAIGKRQIKDREFSVKLEQAFTDIMNQFMETNGIDKDSDVIAIKKDACFVINKKVSQSDFGRYIHFVPKNEYHAFIYLKPVYARGGGMEFYFKRDNDEIDIKGLVSDKTAREKILSLHKDGILNLLSYTVQLAEQSGNDPHKMNDFLHEFVEMYKKKELEYAYYREFNIESRFRYQVMGSTIMADLIDDSMLQKINIEYNYTHIILPLINLIA